MGAPVIVTRPAAPGRRLAAELRRRGVDVAWWPAFDINPPADEAAVQRTLARLPEYDLALFVSPNAVHATAERMDTDWPPGTVIGAVGASTREAALLELRGAGRVTMVAPDDGDESGSEGFWRAWRASGLQAHRALLLRAATDVAVDPVAVYDRAPHRLGEGDRSRLRAWLGRGVAPTTVLTSAEAVAAVLDQVSGVDGAADWLRRGRAIATHPRVAQRLHDAGFLHVETSAPDDSALIGKLESIQG